MSTSRPYKIFMDGFLASFADRPTEQRRDERRIENGHIIHAENHYVDEPFIVIADDGAWVCGLSIGDGQEADRSQRTAVRRSYDQGKTWSAPIDIEPAEGPEGSKAVLLKTPSGRLYAFYIFNTDDIREVIGDNPPYESGMCERVDSLGDFVFKYSDDHGKSWSDQRYVIPMREFEIDTENPYQGKIRFGMNSAIPLVHNGEVFVPFTKVGSFGEGLFSRSEGVLFKSSNLLTEINPEKITWETLPEGRIGLRSLPNGGPIAEEHSFASLSDGSIHCVYRTIAGWPLVSYSRDNGRTWSPSEYMTYADGRRVKCSRAANFAWRCKNGKFLYWYHNHGGEPFMARIQKNSHYSFEDRNPVWLLGGREVEGPKGIYLEWSQPEIMLYTDDPLVRISYPDLLEENGEYYFTETNKDIGRIHQIDKTLIEGLWDQFDNAQLATQNLILNLETPHQVEISAPWLPDFTVIDERFADYRSKHSRQGMTVDFWIKFEELGGGQIIAENMTRDRRGFCISTTRRGTIELVLKDDMTENHWACDKDTLQADTWHHVGIVVDAGPHIITFVIDGKVLDGGKYRQFGWGRFSPYLETLKGDETLRVGKTVKGKLHSFRLYDRALRNSELIGNWRTGLSTFTPSL